MRLLLRVAFATRGSEIIDLVAKSKTASMRDCSAERRPIGWRIESNDINVQSYVSVTRPEWRSYSSSQGRTALRPSLASSNVSTTRGKPSWYQCSLIVRFGLCGFSEALGRNIKLAVHFPTFCCPPRSRFTANATISRGSLRRPKPFSFKFLIRGFSLAASSDGIEAPIENTALCTHALLLPLSLTRISTTVFGVFGATRFK
ncbi:hypothetical protein D3C74_368230 [compost metagenome]